MQGNKSPGVIEAEVAMLRTQSDHALLIVEGPDDSKFWRRWLDSSCEILIGEGKLNIIGCLERLDLKKVRGVLGLVDDDYDHVENVTPDSTNLIMTDANDLECILCRSSALDGILAELGDAGRIERFEAAVGTNVREALLDRALVFGRLRWAARRFKLTLNKIEPTPQFVSESQWTVDVERLLNVASEQLESINQPQLAMAIQQLPEDVDPWYIVRGHDLVEILRIGLKHIIGNRPRGGRERISSSLRLAFQRIEFEGECLWRDIRAWEGRNAPYLVLAAQ